jgi:hypothetical protein
MTSHAKLYAYEAGTLRCFKCGSSDIDLQYREADHSGPERLACTCTECSFEWAMACKPLESTQWATIIQVPNDPQRADVLPARPAPLQLPARRARKKR